MPRTKIRKTLATLQSSQLELLADDSELFEGLKLAMRTEASFPIANRVIDGEIVRTIEGASTITVTLMDRDRVIRNSGRLGEGVDINVEGLWFRLVAVRKSGNNVQLTFESREVAILRTFKDKKTSAWGKTTRAWFVWSLVNEARSILPNLEFVSPELQRGDTLPAAVKKTADAAAKKKREQERLPGFAPNVKLKIKTADADAEQLRNLDTILSVAGPALRKIRVCAVMCAIQESEVRNLGQPLPGAGNYLGPDPNGNPVGVFQQIKKYGWPASRDIPTDAAAFYAKIESINAQYPNLNYHDLIEKVQHSGYPDRYAQWRTNAERIVTAWGAPGTDTTRPGDAASNNNQNQWAQDAIEYQYTRGHAAQLAGGQKGWEKEDSWKCGGRLAEEVNWRFFEVSGRIYSVSEPELFQSQPRARLSEDSEGIDWIDYDYDVAKPGATVTITGRADAWDCPPGSTLEIFDDGPVDGRWLVSEIRRKVFKTDVTITCKKPRARLPEPKQNDVTGLWDNPWTGENPGGDGAPPSSVQDRSNLTGNDQTRIQLAKRLLQAMEAGQYRDDNGQQKSQLQKLAEGKQLRSQCGTDVNMDPRVLGVLSYLIDQGYLIGTFALCEDHHCNDGQHPKGGAVDISSLGKNGTFYALNTANIIAQQYVLEVMDLLAPAAWDLICNGVGAYDPTVQAKQYDNGTKRGGVWASDHTNHIHFGIAPGTHDV